MPKQFLETVADQIIGKFNGDYSDLSIILPNKRSIVFLKKHLDSLHDSPYWMPDFYSIEDFVSKVSGYTIASSTELIFSLFRVYLESTNGNGTFEEFSSWGPIVLKDFNDIDLNIGNHELIFSYLNDVKNLKKWNLDKEDLSDFDKNYLVFFRNLPKLYSTLKKQLHDNQIAYQGMALRKIIEDGKDAKFPTKNYLVVGFNALSGGEIQLFKYLRQNFNTQILFEVDKYYLDDVMNEAGYFMRVNQRYYKETALYVDNKGFNEPKEIDFYAVDGRFNQVQVVGNLLSNMVEDSSFNPEETAVLLADEGLLIPLLDIIPEKIQSINVTMSYPIQLTALNGLVLDLFDLFVFANKTYSDKSEIRYHHVNLTKIFRNHLLKSLVGINEHECFNLISKVIIKNNNVTLSRSELIKIYSQPKNNCGFVDRLFSLKDVSAWSISLHVHGLLELLYLKISEKSNVNPIEKETLSKIVDILKRISNYVEDFQNLDVKVLKSVYRSLAQFEGIPFEGEPLKGLQVMGMLESRVIGFKNVIIVSMNEGIFPSKKSFQTFLLPEIRKEYDIPMPSDEESTWAYYFYRIIGSANNIHLVYNTQSSEMESGEESRFLRQLRYEIPRSKPQISLRNHNVSFRSTIDMKPKQITISNSHNSIARLLQIGTNPERGFSPSSISMLLRCRRKYYYAKVLGINELESVDEQVGANVRGTAIHKTLDDLFKPAVQDHSVLDEEFYFNMLESFPQVLYKNYLEEYGSGDIEHGKNLLLMKVDEQMIRNYLTVEQQNLDRIENLELEKRLVKQIDIEIEGKKVELFFGGTADRIDIVDGLTRVLDYKTGKVNEKSLKIALEGDDVLDAIFDGDEHDKAFQLLSYAWLYNSLAGNYVPISSAIIAMKYKNYYKPLEIGGNNILSEQILNAFGDRLIRTIHDLFSMDFNYSLTDNQKNCEYCEFKDLCDR